MGKLPLWAKAALARLEEGRTWADKLIFWQGVIAAVFGWSIVSYFGIEEDFPIFALGSIWLGGIAAYAIAYLLARTRLQRRIMTAAVLVSILAILGYALRVQHNREQAEKAKAAMEAENYRLDYDGPTLSPQIIAGKRGPHGGPVMAALTVALQFDNPNNFDIWVKSFRRDFKVAGQTSQGNNKAVYARVPPGARRFVVSDNTVIFNRPVEFSPETVSSLDFEICYGKARSRMNKGFWNKITLIFQPDQFGGFSAPPNIVPVDEEEGPFGYLDKCRG
jgi:hypothetical protein